jgi:hypothetical protein
MVKLKECSHILFIDGGLSILQYADNTILFMEHNLEKARNLKLILTAFEQLSYLKIVFSRMCLGLSLLSTKLVLIRMTSSHFSCNMSCNSPLARITKKI